MESVDVKALRAKFNNKHNTSDTSSRDSGSPKSPRPGFGRAILPVTENEISRLSPTPPLLLAGPVPLRLPKADHVQSASSSPVRVSVQPGDISKFKQTGEILQNIMLKQQKISTTKPMLGLPEALTPSPTPLRLQLQPRQRSSGDVIPLRRPLPPERPLPLKPKRPPNVILDPFLRFKRDCDLGVPIKSVATSSGPADRRASMPSALSPPKLPQRLNKPKTLPHQIASLDFEDEQYPYDDIASFEQSGSCSDNSSHCLDRDEYSDVYEFIDEDSGDVNHVTVEKSNVKDAKRQVEQQAKERAELKKRLQKNFQLQGEVEALHTTRVRHDWHGGSTLDLSVQQGEIVEILRVNNNPEGKWLARSMTSNYGYISNTCVDIDYGAIKKMKPPSKRIDANALPPPPPDPLKQLKAKPKRNSSIVNDNNHDDVYPIPDDFPPPPPPEIFMDVKAEKELRKKFKYEGPITVLHTMMVDPNCVIKKPGGKDLHVSHGEVLDIIQLTDNKKVLCRNNFGKYGYVFRSYLLPMEGGIYDDVDYAHDVYDNDAPY